MILTQKQFNFLKVARGKKNISDAHQFEYFFITKKGIWTADNHRIHWLGDPDDSAHIPVAYSARSKAELNHKIRSDTPSEIGDGGVPPVWAVWSAINMSGSIVLPCDTLSKIRECLDYADGVTITILDAQTIRIGADMGPFGRPSFEGAADVVKLSPGYQFSVNTNYFCAPLVGADEGIIQCTTDPLTAFVVRAQGQMALIMPRRTLKKGGWK